jgi:hypothetical protein
MTAANTLSIVGRVEFAGANARVLSVGKSSAGNDLGAERFERRAGERANTPRAIPKNSPSQNDTDSSVIEIEPRLNAAFVAQALGQVMAPAVPDAPSALAAYQRNHVRLRGGFLLDSTL